MATFKSFEEMEIWQKARSLTKEIYGVTKVNEFARDWGLRDQIRNASVSIMSNVAEGFERNGIREFVQFLSTAKGSAGEVRSHLYVALDQEYIGLPVFKRLCALTKDIGLSSGSLMRYLRQSGFRGTKFL